MLVQLVRPSLASAIIRAHHVQLGLVFGAKVRKAKGQYGFELACSFSGFEAQLHALTLGKATLIMVSSVTATVIIKVQVMTGSHSMCWCRYSM